MSKSNTSSSGIVGERPVRRLMIFFFRIYGIWPAESNSRVYFVYRYVLHVFFTFSYTFFMLGRLVQLRNLIDLISTSGMTLTLVSLCIKLINLFYHMHRVQIVLSQVEHFELTNMAEEELVSSRIRFFSTLAYGYYIVANTAGLVSYVGAWYRTELPYAAWYPGLDTDSLNTYFVFLFTYQVSGMLMMSAVNITMELFPSYVMFLLSVQMEVIGGRIAALGSKLANEKRFERKSEAPDVILVSKQLKKCIGHHQELCRTIAEFEEAFTRGFFAQICLSGFIICCNAYMLTFTAPLDDIFSFMFSVTFLCTMVAQIFLPCYFGNELILRSEQMTNFAYNNGWHQTDRLFRRMLITFMERVKRRASITVGKLFPLSLDTFTSIISFAYKLYAVLAK